MTDRPIIFSTPMVRALLDGRKTMTRRQAWRDRKSRREDNLIERHPSPWQKVTPSDRLWVRETFYETDKLTRIGFAGHEPKSAVYRADWPAPDWQNAKWTSSRHMPRRASRLTLVVTATKIERLQEISEADARAEGTSRMVMDSEARFFLDEKGSHCCGFAGLWSSLHGPESWDANPEVVAITFTVHKCNIDRMEPPREAWVDPPEKVRAPLNRFWWWA